MMQVDTRNGGCAAAFGKKIYLWGGQTSECKHFEGDSSSDEEEGADLDLTSLPQRPVDLPRIGDKDHPFDVFDVDTGQWARQPTTGEVPALGYGSTLHYHEGNACFYLFAGWKDSNFDSDVYCCSTSTWEWKKLSPVSIKPSPRYLTGVLLHEDSLCVFAGVGQPPPLPRQDPDADYVQYVNKGVSYTWGWNNEYYEFNIKKCEWSAPVPRGSVRPPPVSAHAFVKFSPTQAVYFGGRRPTEYTNDVYFFDLVHKVFSGPILPASYPYCVLPSPLTFHSITPLLHPSLVGTRLQRVGPELTQRLLVLWGKCTLHNISDEAWILHTAPFNWQRVDVGGLKPRTWHTVTPFYPRCGHCTECNDTECSCTSTVKCNSTECSAFVFGGNVHLQGSSGDRVAVGDMRALSSGLRSLESICTGFIIQFMIKTVEDIDQMCLPPKVKSSIKNLFLCRREYPPVVIQCQTVGCYLRGVDVIAQTSITIRAGEARSFQWKEYGLRLHVPEGALPPHLSESTLHIQASLCGQFEFPDSSELVSAVYWISCASKFSKPVTLDLQHCAVGQTSSLQFVRAKCTQKTLPYQFQPIDGVFICDSDYGSTSITHFSGIGIVRTLQSWLGRSSETYLAQVYLKNVNLNEWKVYFIVTKNLEPALTAVKGNLGRAVKDKSLTVEFERNEMVVEPCDEEGWEIVTPYHPSIRKDEVEDFNGKADPPKCELDVKWNGSKDAESLPYVKFNFRGAKPPRNYCLVKFSQDKPSSTESISSTRTHSGVTDEQLDTMITDEHIRTVCLFLPRWEDVANQLGVNPLEITGITFQTKNHGVLSKWRRENSNEATYKKLAEVLERLKEVQCAEKVRELITPTKQ